MYVGNSFCTSYKLYKQKVWAVPKSPLQNNRAPIIYELGNSVTGTK